MYQGFQQLHKRLSHLFALKNNMKLNRESRRLNRLRKTNLHRSDTFF